MEKRIRLASAYAFVALAAIVPAGAYAQAGTAAAPPKEPVPAPPPKDSNITAYGGYRFSGGFTDVNTGKTWELTEGPAYAIAADFPIDRRSQWEIFVSHRNSSLKASGFSPVADNIGLGITYYHVGGTYFFDQQVGKGLYGVGGLGLTNFGPKQSGLSSETRFSLNLGLGWMIPLAKYVALKLEARGYVTLVDSSGGFFCSGGCVVQISGTTFVQGEVLAGISARF
jgi:hypothetical protein